MKKILIFILIFCSTILSAKEPTKATILLSGRDYVELCEANHGAIKATLFGGNKGYYLKCKTDNEESDTYINIWLGKGADEAIGTLEALQTYKRDEVDITSFKDISGTRLSVSFNQYCGWIEINNPDIIGTYYLYGNKKWWLNLKNIVEYTSFK